MPLLQSLRESLQQENSAALERSQQRPTSAAADEKADSGAASAGRSAKGAKGAKAGRSAAGTSGGAAAPGDVAPGKYSYAGGASSSSAAVGSERPRASSFKLADAKGLERAMAAAGPRGRRARELRAIVQLEVVRFSSFRQPPSTPYERYARALRAAAPVARQVAIQSGEEDRSVEAQTEEVLQADKEVQCHLGHDDTALENMMRHVQQRRGHGNGSGGGRSADSSCNGGRGHGSGGGSDSKREGDAKGEEDGVDAALSVGDQPGGIGVGGGGGRGGGNGGGAGKVSLRLGRFLQRAGPLLETLCMENLQATRGHGGGADGKNGDGAAAATALFTTGQPWRELGADVPPTDPIRRLLSARNVSAITAFPGRAGLVATAHVLRCVDDCGGAVVGKPARNAAAGAVAAAAEEKIAASGAVASNGKKAAPLLPGRSVVCVWEAGRAVGAAPAGLAVGEGRLTALAGVGVGAGVIVGGTAEGTVLLWDLSEPRSRHSGADAGHLSLTCGLRHPTYTTAGGSGLSGLSGAGGGGSAGGGSSSIIVAVVVVPNSATAAAGNFGGGGRRFELASLDDRGLVTMWLAMAVSGAADDAGSQSDLGLGPGGRMRLAATRAL
ncbi:unnamed protein product, partial [Phaeothamnion confervicola]